MAEKSNGSEAEEQGAGSEGSARRMQVGLRLSPGEQSTQPLFCNFSGVTTAGGLLLLEFGFLEPGGLNAVAKAARAGANPPDAINGQRICRLVLPPDTAAQLAQQLNGLLANAAKARGKQK